MKNSGIYTPENLTEEALMIMGRVNAFAEYVRKQNYSIDREVCAAILGFDLEDKQIEESETGGWIMPYIGVGPESGKVVEDSQAFEYALERCTAGTLEEQAEFKEMLVEWYYSGNWIKEEI